MTHDTIIMIDSSADRNKSATRCGQV